MLSDQVRTVLTLLEQSHGWIVKVNTQAGQHVHLAVYDANGQLTTLTLATFNELHQNGCIRQVKAETTPNGDFTLLTYRLKVKA